ncbi:unnamed protein product [Linum perenne]
MDETPPRQHHHQRHHRPTSTAAKTTEPKASSTAHQGWFIPHDHNPTHFQKVPMYVLGQLLGATLGSLTLKVLFHRQTDINPIMTQYSSPTTDLEAFLWEFIITFILMFSICANATDHRASKGLAGFAIGSTLLVNVLVAGPITGASMNPARSIGPAVASGVYDNLWLYILAPVLGALAGAMVYNGLRVPIPEDKTNNEGS